MSFYNPLLVDLQVFFFGERQRRSFCKSYILRQEGIFIKTCAIIKEEEYYLLLFQISN